MTVVQCDKCKKIIDTGKRVRIEYGDFKPKEDSIKYFKLVNHEVDLCPDCFSKLEDFLGLEY